MCVLRLVSTILAEISAHHFQLKWKAAKDRKVAKYRKVALIKCVGYRVARALHKGG